jgi:hypothetical protein
LWNVPSPPPPIITPPPVADYQPPPIDPLPSIVPPPVMTPMPPYFPPPPVPTAVPEPSTWAMLLLGFVGLGYAGFRRSKGEFQPSNDDDPVPQKRHTVVARLEQRPLAPLNFFAARKAVQP